MINEFGRKLDRNGYAPSIMQDNIDCCYLCGRSDQKLDRHEPFNGSLRGKSKELGMWVTLCHDRCHFGQAHKYYQVARSLKMDAQRAAMKEYHWTIERFIKEFGRNWI